EVGLEAQNRTDLSRLRFGVERPGAVQVAVIGDGQRIHAERLHPIEQVGDAVGAVEERVLAVRVDMNERHGYRAESVVFCAVMQWLLLFITFVVMAVLQRLARSFGAPPPEAQATLALGCVTLAATLTGVIAQRLRVPRIVGYLIAGFVAGPAWLRIVREPELQALSVISTGALALIAFAAGSELTIDALRAPPRRAALLRIVTGAMVLPFAAVVFVVLTISPWFPLTAHQPFRDALVVALALAFAQYVRAIRGSLPLVFVILAFVIAQAVRLLGLDAVLIALAAGCTLRYAAPGQRERVRGELKRCAIPVYVVFFALAGSNLQLAALGEMWPWALLLAGLRITGLWGGLRLAGGAGRRGSATWTTYGWLGLISQGGLAVTLAAVLRRAFPEWNVSLQALLVAMIGVHQLAGPICFQWVLRRGGEITEEVEV